MTAASSKLSVEASSEELITALIIRAESYGTTQRLDTFVEGTAFIDQAEISRRAEEEAARRLAEEEARRRAAAEEEARRRAAEAEVNRVAEQARQQACARDLSSAFSALRGCQTQVDRANTEFRRAQQILERSQQLMQRAEEPRLRCEADGAALERQLQQIRARVGANRDEFHAAKASVAAAMARHENAKGFAPNWRCDMRNVGHRNFGREGRGNYSGVGPTPAKALEAAFLQCPESSSSGCGKEDNLRADITCTPIL